MYRGALSEHRGAEHMPSTAQAHFSACAPPLYSPFSVLCPWGGARRVAVVGLLWAAPGGGYTGACIGGLCVYGRVGACGGMRVRWMVVMFLWLDLIMAG